MKCLDSLLKMTEYLNIHSVLNQGTPESINFYQLLTKYTSLLTKVLMSVVYFWTYLMPLIKYGTTVLFSN